VELTELIKDYVPQNYYQVLNLIFLKESYGKQLNILLK